MPDLPSGTVTFLFTDIEGSARLWEEHPEAMRFALARHDVLLRQCIEAHGGYVFKTVGDAFCASFVTAPEALAAALAAQRALLVETWEENLPLRVRMALHIGATEERDSDYFGPALNRLARLLAIGHGGQVLLSNVAQELTRDALPPAAGLRSLGKHLLRDLKHPEPIFQLLHPDLPDDFPPLRSLQMGAPNNLPQQVTAFIGRESAREEIKALLNETRLLTLTGVGGCGKTRLALQVAGELLEDYPDGVYLIELAALTDPLLVIQAVAQTLEVREEPGRALLRTLTEHLQRKRMLLVLDNCEHLLSACAHLSEALLRAASGVILLATSRERLGIAGERVYDTPSLAVPGAQQPVTPESLISYEAVRLFLDRARAVAPGFAPTAANAPGIARICQGLDGIPLAIELAAARLRSLSVEDLQARLDDRFRLLTGGRRTAVPRQQTLRALIDWSYDLLTQPEKTLLCRLAVFAGGWTLNAAEQVGAGDSLETWDVLEALSSLVEKSLVVAEPQETGLRYRLLETVRQYAAERLQQSKEGEAVRKRHCDHFLALAEESSRHIGGTDQKSWIDTLEQEHDNLRVALAWCVEAGKREEEIAQEESAISDNRQSEIENQKSKIPEAGLRLSGALTWFWEIRGYWQEGRAYLEAALARQSVQTRTSERGRALIGVGVLAKDQGDYAAARSYLEESLAIWQELEHNAGIASALCNLALVALNLDDTTTALAYFTQALELDRALGNRTGEAIDLSNLGVLAETQDDYAAALAYYAQALAIYQELGDRHGEAHCIGGMGWVKGRQGDYQAAQTYYNRALDLNRDLGDRARTARVLNNLGCVQKELGDYAAALALYEQALAISRDLGDQQLIAYILNNLGSVKGAQGDHAAALAYHEQALAINRAFGNRAEEANNLDGIGRVNIRQGDNRAAQARLAQALEMRRELGRKSDMVDTLESFAILAAAHGHYERFVLLSAFCSALRQTIGFPCPPNEQEQHADRLSAIRAVLGEVVFAARWAAGTNLTQEQAIACALEETGGRLENADDDQEGERP